MSAKVGRRSTREEKERLVDEMRRGLERQGTQSDSLGSRPHPLRSRECGRERMEERSDSPSSPVWVEATEKEQAAKPDRTVPGIEVNIGAYVVRVSRDFDRVLFTEVCRTLSELC